MKSLHKVTKTILRDIDNQGNSGNDFGLNEGGAGSRSFVLHYYGNKDGGMAGTKSGIECVVIEQEVKVKTLETKRGLGRTYNTEYDKKLLVAKR